MPCRARRGRGLRPGVWGSESPNPPGRKREAATRPCESRHLPFAGRWRGDLFLPNSAARPQASCHLLSWPPGRWLRSRPIPPGRKSTGATQGRRHGSGRSRRPGRRAWQRPRAALGPVAGCEGPDQGQHRGHTWTRGSIPTQSTVTAKGAHTSSDSGRSTARPPARSSEAGGRRADAERKWVLARGGGHGVTPGGRFSAGRPAGRSARWARVTASVTVRRHPHRLDGQGWASSWARAEGDSPR